MYSTMRFKGRALNEMEMDELFRARDFEIILLLSNKEGTQKGSLYFCL